MVRTASQPLAMGMAAPDFLLPDTTGKKFSLPDFVDLPVLLVMFSCNHCPFVQHVAPQVAELAREYQRHGVGVVAINSNDVEMYPDDSPEKMIEEIARHSYSFPYLYDQSQAVAKAYRAACTPDFYVFDKDRKLFYHGQLDGSRPGNQVPVTGEDLRAALNAALAGKAAPIDQKPSLGCNIKWRPGNEPEYFR